MEKLFYFVTIESYDWFIGHRSETKGFTTLIEAWKYYKSESKFDFDYMDHYQSTNKPRRARDADAYVLPKQRSHARSKEEYESYRAQFALFGCDPFSKFKKVSNFDDVKDIEVVEVVKETEEYLFDNYELLF